MLLDVELLTDGHLGANRAFFASSLTLAGPGANEAFVTASDDIAGFTSSQGLAGRLTLLDSAGNLRNGPFAVMESDTPASGLASPVFRSNPGFVQGGFTGGAHVNSCYRTLRLTNFRMLQSGLFRERH